MGLAQKRKKRAGGDQRGRLPAYATPQRGAAIAEAVPKHNSQTRSGPGGLGGSLPDRCCTGLSTRFFFLVVDRAEDGPRYLSFNRGCALAISLSPLVAVAIVAVSLAVT